MSVGIVVAGFGIVEFEAVVELVESVENTVEKLENLDIQS